jgi:curved DNA-binding protein CbpA
MFQLVRTAYEILKDDEERLNYDYLLENPSKN